MRLIWLCAVVVSSLSASFVTGSSRSTIKAKGVTANVYLNKNLSGFAGQIDLSLGATNALKTGQAYLNKGTLILPTGECVLTGTFDQSGGANNLTLDVLGTMSAASDISWDAITLAADLNRLYVAVDLPTNLTLPSSSATLELGLLKQLNKTITLSSGTLKLWRDLEFGNSGQLSGNGILNGNRYKVSLRSMGLYNAGTLYLQDLSALELLTTVSWNSAITFGGVNTTGCEVLGNGNILDLSAGGSLIVSSGYTVTLRDVVIKGLSQTGGSIYLYDNTSSLCLAGCAINLDNSYTVSKGTWFFSDMQSRVMSNRYLLSFTGGGIYIVDGIRLIIDNLGTLFGYNGIKPLPIDSINSFLRNGGIVRGPENAKVTDDFIFDLASYVMTETFELNAARRFVVRGDSASTTTLDGGGYALYFPKNVSNLIKVNDNKNLVIKNIVLDGFDFAHSIALGTGATYTFGDNVAIKLCNSFTVADTYSFVGTYTIDCQGNTITFSGQNRLYCGPGSTLTVCNGSVENMTNWTVDVASSGPEGDYSFSSLNDNAINFNTRSNFASVNVPPGVSNPFNFFNYPYSPDGKHAFFPGLNTSTNKADGSFFIYEYNSSAKTYDQWTDGQFTAQTASGSPIPSAFKYVVDTRFGTNIARNGVRWLNNTDIFVFGRIYRIDPVAKTVTQHLSLTTVGAIDSSNFIPMCVSVTSDMNMFAVASTGGNVYFFHNFTANTWTYFTQVFNGNHVCSWVPGSYDIVTGDRSMLYMWHVPHPINEGGSPTQTNNLSKSNSNIDYLMECNSGGFIHTYNSSDNLVFAGGSDELSAFGQVKYQVYKLTFSNSKWSLNTSAGLAINMVWVNAFSSSTVRSIRIMSSGKYLTKQYTVYRTDPLNVTNPTTAVTVSVNNPSINIASGVNGWDYGTYMLINPYSWYALTPMFDSTMGWINAELFALSGFAAPIVTTFYHTSLDFEDATSKLFLRDMTLTITNPLTMTLGEINFMKKNTMIGSNSSCLFKGGIALNLAKASQLNLTNKFTLSLDKAISTSAIVFQDPSAELNIDSATLVTTASGVVFATGIVNVSGSTTFSSDFYGAQGFVVRNSAQLNVLPGATLTVDGELKHVA